MLATKTNRDEGGDVLIMPWRPSLTACLPSIPATRAPIGNEDKITIYNHTAGPGILSDHLFNIKDIKYSSNWQGLAQAWASVFIRIANWK